MAPSHCLFAATQRRTNLRPFYNARIDSILPHNPRIVLHFVLFCITHWRGVLLFGLLRPHRCPIAECGMKTSMFCKFMGGGHTKQVSQDKMAIEMDALRNDKLALQSMLRLYENGARDGCPVTETWRQHRLYVPDIRPACAPAKPNRRKAGGPLSNDGARGALMKRSKTTGRSAACGAPAKNVRVLGGVARVFSPGVFLWRSSTLLPPGRHCYRTVPVPRKWAVWRASNLLTPVFFA